MLNDFELRPKYQLQNEKTPTIDAAILIYHLLSNTSCSRKCLPIGLTPNIPK